MRTLTRTTRNVIGRTVLLGWIVASLSVGVSLGQARRLPRKQPEPTPAPAPAPAPVETEAPEAPPLEASPETAPVPLTEVPERLLELNDWIAATQQSLATSVEAITTDAQITALEETINAGAQQVDELLYSSPSLPDLRESASVWQTKAGVVLKLQVALARRDEELQVQLSTLTADRLKWQATHDQLVTQEAPPELLDRVSQDLDALEILNTQVQANAKRVLVLEGQIAKINTIASGTTARLTQAVDGFQDRLMLKDSVPIWRAFSQSAPPGQSVSSLGSKFSAAGAHVLNSRNYLVTMTFSLLIFIAAMLFLRRATDTDSEEGFSNKRRSAVNFILFGVFCSVAFVSAFTAQAPLLISSIQKLVILTLVLILLPRLTVMSARLHLTVLLAFYAANSMFDLAATQPGVDRVVIAIMDATGAVAMWWLGARTRIPARTDGLRTFGMTMMRLGAILLTFALVANTFGYVLLSMVLSDGVLESARQFSGAMTLFLGLAYIVKLATRLPGIRSLATVRLRGAGLVRWTRRVLFSLGLFLWFAGVLHTFTIDKQVGEWVQWIWAFEIGVGTVAFTVGSILEALLVLVFGIGVANAVRFVLKEELLERMNMSRGLPDAIANAFHYLVLFGVFLLALGAAGVELSKLTVLTGALGVGIGFGLQNVVNNFVSGIILQFERPIHIGDVVELPGVKGKVSNMGVRSSTLQTFEGAEVIVPNGNLVANQLINWTLSAQRRRVDVPVGVAYGTNTERVISLLCEAAGEHPDVIKDPAPQALFIGFGDSSLNFELRFWAPDQDLWIVLRSDVMRAIVRAFDANGIEIPFPQRDLHVRSVDPDVLTQSGLKPTAKTQSRKEEP